MEIWERARRCCPAGLVRGWELIEAVTSPTFTLMHRYQGRLEVFHFDLYRLQDPDEILDLGYDELFYGDGVSMWNGLSVLIICTLMSV